MTAPRICPVCETAVAQRVNETNARFRTRLYCGRTCAGVARRGMRPANAGINRAVDLPPSQRECPSCKQRLVAREEESVDQFAKRTYCNGECARIATRPSVLANLPERF